MSQPITDRAVGSTEHTVVAITLCDPRNGGRPQRLDFLPDTSKGWIWWDREYRDINEVHRTANGIQIELIA
jgi:hypothetical protein